MSCIYARHTLLSGENMQYSEEKLEQALLAMMYLYHFDGCRVWKGYPFDLMDQLHSKGYIENPVNKNKSVYLTQAGLAEGQKLAEMLFGNKDE